MQEHDKFATVVRKMLFAQKSHDVFDISSEALSKISLKALNSKYKSLALLVHPDKNPDPRANEAFKRLRTCYEELQTSVTQRSSTLRQETEPTKSSVNDDHKCTEFSDTSKKKKNSVSEFLRKWTSEEEIFMAAQELREQKRRGKKRKSPFSDIRERNEILTENILQQEIFEGVDDRMSKWQNFRNGRKNSGRDPSTSLPSETNTSVDYLPQSQSVLCLLCRRSFKSIEMLQKHELHSELHKANMFAKS